MTHPVLLAGRIEIVAAGLEGGAHDGLADSLRSM
jgi:hypothetical protein